jgi:hypothetical protein
MKRVGGHLKLNSRVLRRFSSERILNDRLFSAVSQGLKDHISAGHRISIGDEGAYQENHLDSYLSDLLCSTPIPITKEQRR